MKQHWTCVYFPSKIFSNLLQFLSQPSHESSLTFQNQQNFILQQFTAFLLDALCFLFQSRQFHQPSLQSLCYYSFSLLFETSTQLSLPVGVALSSLFSLPSISPSQVSLIFLFLVKVYTRQTPVTELTAFIVHVLCIPS